MGVATPTPARNRTVVCVLVDHGDWFHAQERPVALPEEEEEEEEEAVAQAAGRVPGEARPA